MSSKSSCCSDFSFQSEEEDSKIFKLKQKNQKLNIINEDLITKNKILKEQIERALSINSNLEETFSKHNDTVKELIAVKAEKEDLENRLRISIQTNEELTMKIRKSCNENSSNNMRSEARSSIKDQELTINEIQSPKRNSNSIQNSQLNEQTIEVSQDKSSNSTQIEKQSSESFENITLSPMQNQRKNNTEEIENQNISLRKERDKMMNLVNRTNDLTRHLEIQLKKAQDEIDELREKNRKLTNESLKKELITDSTEITIPEAVFSSPEFPLDLENMVSSIYRNPKLQLITKIRQIISVITHYFKSRYEQIELDLKESKENGFKLSEKTNSLIDFLHKIFPCQNVNYNAILDDEGARSALEDSVNKLKIAVKEKDQLIKQHEEMAQEKDREMKNSIENLQLEHKEYKQFKKDAKAKEEELENLKKNLENELSLCKEKLEKQKEKIKSLKDKSADFGNQKQELNNIKLQLTQQHALQIDELNKKFNNDLLNKNREIEDLKKDFDALENEKNNLLQYLDKCKLVIKQHRNKKEKWKKEIELLKQQNSDEQKELKDQLNERIDQLLQIRSKEAKDFTQMINNLKIQIEQLTKERDELLSKNATFSIDIQKLETKINALNSDRDRERREFDSRLIAQRNFDQTEMASKYNEMKAQFNEMKHELYQNIAKHLSPFTNYTVNVNENNINSLLLDIKKKVDSTLSREARVREILRINSFESIEEVLTKKMNHLTKRSKNKIEI